MEKRKKSEVVDSRETEYEVDISSICVIPEKVLLRYLISPGKLKVICIETHGISSMFVYKTVHELIREKKIRTISANIGIEPESLVTIIYDFSPSS